MVNFVKLKKNPKQTNKKPARISLLLELFLISELEEQILGITVYGNIMCFLWQ